VLGALGVVFGDIGTSPLYAMRECFDLAKNPHAVAATRDHVFGVMSLFFWALTLIVSIKYCVLAKAGHSPSFRWRWKSWRPGRSDGPC
jgi:KUP system potassium uptake protein